jgi:hypothetical protein
MAVQLSVRCTDIPDFFSSWSEISPPHFRTVEQEVLKHWPKTMLPYQEGQRCELGSRSSQMNASGASPDALGLMWKPDVRKRLGNPISGSSHFSHDRDVSLPPSYVLSLFFL